jgi:hypothetical protein
LLARGVGNKTSGNTDLFPGVLLARMKIRTSAYRRDVADDVTGAVRLAPVYDLVSTLLYVPKVGLALTLNGSADWPKSLDAPRPNPLRSCPWP